MDIEDAECIIREVRPKLLYVNPTFSNPTGYAWSRKRREAILDLCRRNDVLILEDDPYGEFHYDAADERPSILSLDEHPKGSCVIYSSTFSKIVAPALRTGWAVGDPVIIQAMTRAKQAADLHSSSMDQQALYQLMRNFDLDGHIAFVRGKYGERMRRMHSLLEENARGALRWNAPKGGMFLWAEAPEFCDTEILLQSAVRNGVAFVPGKTFFSDAPRRNAMRLNFTHADPSQMRLGVERLTQSLKEYPQPRGID
jgi:2-aminoadipate transaminase